MQAQPLFTCDCIAIFNCLPQVVVTEGNAAPGLVERLVQGVCDSRPRGWRHIGNLQKFVGAEPCTTRPKRLHHSLHRIPAKISLDPGEHMLEGIVHRRFFARLLARRRRKECREPLIEFLVHAEDPQLLKHRQQEERIARKRVALERLCLWWRELFAVPPEILGNESRLFGRTKRLDDEFLPFKPGVGGIEHFAYQARGHEAD